MPDTDKSNSQNHGEFVEREMSEAEWHIKNATTDVTQFMRPVADGETVGDATVYTPDGQSMALSSLWADKPALIVTGSMTCPPSRRLNPATTAISGQFADRVQVAVLYVIDAHPSGDRCPYTGTDWTTQTNRDENILIRQPRDQAERCERAREYRELLGLDSTVVVDGMENSAWAALGKSPNMAILIGTDGVCLICQDWFRPDHLTEFLSDKLAT